MANVRASYFGWVAIALSGIFLAVGPAYAQVKVGVTLSTTGPAASLGIPEKNTLQLVAATPAAKNFEFIFLDDDIGYDGSAS